MAKDLITSDSERVKPGSVLYWLEPGTTEVHGAETYTQDVATSRFSSIEAAYTAEITQRAGLHLQATIDASEATTRALRHEKARTDAERCRDRVRNGNKTSGRYHAPIDRPQS